MHRLDAPVATNRFAEARAAQSAAEDVVPHVVCLAAIGAFVDAAMSHVCGFVLAITQLFQVVAEELSDLLKPLALIVFDGNHEVAFLGHDLLGDRLLAADGVNGHDRVGEVPSRQQFGNRRDLVGLVVGGDLTEREPLLAGPRADDVQWPPIFGSVMRTPTNLASRQVR